MKYEYDLSEIERVIDKIVSYAMHDKNYICYYDYGMRNCPYCTDYLLAKDAVHHAIKSLVDYKVAQAFADEERDSVEINIKCRDFYTVIQGGDWPYYEEIGYVPDKKIDLVTDGLRCEVERLLRDNMCDYDNRNGGFKLIVSRVKSKEKVIKL